MKRIATVACILALAGCGKENAVIKESTQSEESPGVGLRRMILATPAGDLSFTPDNEFPKVYGVLTDWRIGERVATIMSLRDGTASLYTTEKFGIIGGQGHESVRQAAVRYVKTAEQFAKTGTPVTEFAYPKNGQVFYYLLAYDSVQLVTGDMTAIERGSDPTRPLFAAAQDVLTELRLITEK
ncbi:MAG: hypothetical protein GXY61_09060 [Lentisphaerae bacterium]|nr:hypothetical protein [Lentisphaerota bacterium]